jgi:OOP family OmpA-OmpF porin
MRVTGWKTITLTHLIAVLFAAHAWALEDMKGSSDFPEVPRITGSRIVAYAYSDFDEGIFVTSKNKKDRGFARPGGKRTRIMYLAPKDISGPQVMKNYMSALSGLGELDQIYECNPDDCSGLGPAVVWAKDNRIPSSLNGSDFFYATFGYKDQRYRYMTATSDDARYHISVYTAFLTGIQSPQVKQQRAIHLEIVEEADFVATLEIVTPDEISSDIQQKGRIALYGIYFDLDSDRLKTDSAPTLEAIAQVLNSDPGLNIYVVGHTDNLGGYQYNLDLSNRRALSVVDALVDKHGISRDRLQAVGVGPVAPVATNSTEKGKSLNRRVELVAF